MNDRTPHWFRVTLLAAFVGVTAAPRVSAADPPPLTVTNLGLHADMFEATDDGAFVFFAVDEAKQGFLDQNGDGDAFDRVLFVHETATGATTNLGLAVTSSLAVDGHRVAFHVGESDQGQIDANGDGDSLDVVPHVYDSDTSSLTNISTAGSFFPPMIDGDLVLFEVLEQDEAQSDLNLDGDLFDSVLHVHDLSTGVTTSLGLAARASFGGPTPRIEGDVATVIVSEADQGYTDLNADGDTYDGVAFVIDLTAKTTLNLGLAAPWTLPALIFGDAVVVLVDEDQQGSSDLNADGDRYDLVPHVYQPKTPPLTNLGLAAFEPLMVKEHLVFSVSESANGIADLNGDGDAKDLVLFTFDLATGVTQNLGIAAVAPLVDSGRIAFGVYEGSQGDVDLNGDGDAIDWVLHVHDFTTGKTTNLEAEGLPTTFQRQRIGYLLTEFQAGHVDLNGDGDIWISEQIPHVYDLENDTIRNLGVAGVLDVGSDDRMLVRINEQIDGGLDRNGDGDADDDVLSVYEGDHGTTIDLAIDGALAHVADEQITYAVSEAANGAVDRNGDGDADDWVLHIAHVTPGVCGEIEPYGVGCHGGFLEPPELLMRGCARPGHPISIAILRGAPFASAFVTFGAARADLPMGGGCSLLVSPPLPLFLGPITLSTFGSTRIHATLPSLVPSGWVRMQALLDEGTGLGLCVTNGVEFEIE